MQNGNQNKLRIILMLPVLCFSLAVSANSTPDLSTHNVLQRITNIAEASSHAVIVDTRPLSSCQNSTLAGVTCLPVEDMLAPNRRLANWSGILWLLGTAGLSGNEHIVVIGQRPDRRDFIAGLLLLTGQHRITIVEEPTSELLSNNKTSAGATRATTRTEVYTAQMRSELIVLQNELAGLVNSNATLLDGRTESEYYGSAVLSSRGGHIPGASHSSLSNWRTQPAESTAIYGSFKPIAYAHDSYDTLVYLTALHTAGVSAKVYLAGWVEWAANGMLPVDSVSYPQIAARESAKPETTNNSAAMHIDRNQFMFGAAFIFCMIVASFFTGRQLSGKNA